MVDALLASNIRGLLPSMSRIFFLILSFLEETERSSKHNKNDMGSKTQEF